MNQIPLLLIGAGGHARACIDVIECDGRFVIVGLVGRAGETGKQIFGYTVLGIDLHLPIFLQQAKHALVCIGQIKAAEPRIHAYEMLKEFSCVLPVVVSPRAYISSHAVIGEGTIVMHGATINAGAVVGNNCIVNSHALIEHDVMIGDHCHISTSAAVNGGVRIGPGTFIGSNSTIREGLVIGERCLIGMGQHVSSNCGAGMFIPPKND